MPERASDANEVPAVFKFLFALFSVRSSLISSNSTHSKKARTAASMESKLTASLDALKQPVHEAAAVTAAALLRRVRWLEILVGLCMLLCLAALGGCAYLWTRTTFEELTVNHLNVAATEHYKEGIRVTFADTADKYPGAMTGVRLALPQGTAHSTSTLSGVSITGGEFGVLAVGQTNASVNATPGIGRPFIVSGSHTILPVPSS